MPTLTRIWDGNTAGQVGNWAHDKNWLAESLVDSRWQWSLSGSGTNEYYLEAAGGGDPGLSEPDNVQENGTDLAAGTMGSLAASEWDYGDNDGLGFSTIYVRLSDGADPDSKANEFVTFTHKPMAGDNVRIPPGSAAITGSDQSAITLGAVEFELGYAGAVGASTAYLQLSCTGFEFAASAGAFIDLTSSTNIAPEIHATAASPGVGQRGLNLLGSDIATLQVFSGDVGLGYRANESAGVDTVQVLPAAGAKAAVYLGNNVSDAGAGSITVEINERATFVTRSDVGTVTTRGKYIQDEGNWTSLTGYAGTVTPKGGGTNATTVLQNAELTSVGVGDACTLTDLTLGAGGKLNDPANRFTFTNDIQFPDGVGGKGATVIIGPSRKFKPVAI